MASTPAPPSFPDAPPPVPPYLPTSEEATSLGGGSLRLPPYRASHIRRHHPYIRWTRAPARQVMTFTDPRITIADIVRPGMGQPLGPTSVPVVQASVIDSTENEVAHTQPVQQQGLERDITKLLYAMGSHLRLVVVHNRGPDGRQNSN